MLLAKRNTKAGQQCRALLVIPSELHAEVGDDPHRFVLWKGHAPGCLEAEQVAPVGVAWSNIEVRLVAVRACRRRNDDHPQDEPGSPAAHRSSLLPGVDPGSPNRGVDDLKASCLQVNSCRGAYARFRSASNTGLSAKPKDSRRSCIAAGTYELDDSDVRKPEAKRLMELPMKRIGTWQARVYQSFDQAYLERLRVGEAETVRHFVAYFSSLIVLKLRARLWSHSLIEDVGRETFLRVFRALRIRGGIRAPERLGAFVNSVCNNVLLELLRSQRRHATAGEPPDRPDVVGSPETQLAGDELR